MPYAVLFQSGSQTFILVTLHVVYGEAPQDRLGELAAIAEWLRDWARRSEDFNHNLIALQGLRRRAPDRLRALS